MYQTIVVPLDTSERAEKILPHIEALCGIKMGKVILVYVVESPVLAASPTAPPAGAPVVTGEAYLNQVEATRSAGEDYLSRIQTILKTKGIEAEVVVETGAAASRIVEVAEERDADLIALASHGRTGLPRVFFGSVAAGILHRSEIPLLLVRSRDNAEG